MGALLGGLRTRRAIYATIARVAYGCTAVAAQAKHRANSALAMTLTPAKAAKAAAKWHITTQATNAQATPNVGAPNALASLTLVLGRANSAIRALVPFAAHRSPKEVDGGSALAYRLGVSLRPGVVFALADAQRGVG